MNIKPSAAIRKDYNSISELCKKTGEPVYLTKNGEGDLVVMDIDTYTRRESMLKLQKTLLDAQFRRASGETGYTIDEAVSSMRTAIKEAANARK